VAFAGQHGIGMGAPAAGDVRCSTAGAGSSTTRTKRRAAILRTQTCICSGIRAGTCCRTTASGGGTRRTGQGVTRSPDTGALMLWPHRDSAGHNHNAMLLLCCCNRSTTGMGPSDAFVRRSAAWFLRNYLLGEMTLNHLISHSRSEYVFTPSTDHVAGCGADFGSGYGAAENQCGRRLSSGPPAGSHSRRVLLLLRPFGHVSGMVRAAVMLAMCSLLGSLRPSTHGSLGSCRIGFSRDFFFTALLPPM
jgi:hypothetical protein